MSDGMKVAAAVCLGVGLLFGMVYFLIYATTQVSMDTAERRGEAAEKERAQADPSYRLANKDEFQEKCADIQSANEKIENYEDQIKLTKDPVQKQQLMDGKFATEQQKEDLVADYNGLAENENRGAFRANDLPAHIESDDMEVECG